MYITKGLDHFTNVNYVSSENVGLNIVHELTKLSKLK